MARTTATEVKEIMGITLDDAIVDSYIVGANLLVTQVLTGSGFSDELLAEIERWLAAHMIATTRERVSKEEGAGGAFIKYAGEFGYGLSSTQYGQMVKVLDTSGGFSSLDKKKASLKVVTSFND